MKKTLQLIFILLIFQIGYTQKAFQINPPDLVAVIDDFNEYEVVAYAKVKNLSDEALNLKWIKKRKTIPDDWGLAICDTVACHAPHIDSSSFSIGPNEVSRLDVHVYPNSTAGAGDVDVIVYDVANPDDRYVLNATFNDATSNQSIALAPQNIRVYPNPTTDYFSVDGIEGLKQVVVLNLVGREVRRFSIAPKARYKVGDLETGLYLLRLVDHRDKIVKTIRLSKR